MTYEYRVVPAPKKAEKVKGVKGADALIAATLETLLNEQGAEGWEYLRVDTLPVEERQGLTGRTTTFQNVLVFRRRRAEESPRREALPAPSREESAAAAPAPSVDPAPAPAGPGATVTATDPAPVRPPRILGGADRSAPPGGPLAPAADRSEVFGSGDKGTLPSPGAIGDTMRDRPKSDES
ncbi:DUF4177 domain-containing protein [Wenxinia saemankumensis]|uniref:DUF4177 domain-containing protein n=1 Tax=Wenxinia saemankumensis TaxID=1447782 RepID=A0A1M6CJM9_9RHOB|nr:DUF4177 domain-containing protein [Wenxinia saemankumensis]SHI61071.1 hypothetical protein SAMN05444417_1219 [Wenxinia saemankumensis]